MTYDPTTETTEVAPEAYPQELPKVKMNPEWKAPWVSALRSGTYSQGHRRLRRLESFCCLGVLCDLFIEKGLGTWRNGAVIMPFVPELPDDDCDELDDQGNSLQVEEDLLPVYVAQTASVPKEVQLHLANLNDGQTSQGEPNDPLSFPQIADWIEENL